MEHVHALELPSAEFGHGLRAALTLVRDDPGPRQEPEPISPELALVCPELRQRALAALPDRDPDGFLPPPRPASVRDETPAAAGTAPRGRPAAARVAVAAAAYLAVETSRAVVYGVGVTGGLVGAMSLVELFRG